MNSKNIIFSFFIVIFWLWFFVLFSFFSLNKDLAKKDDFILFDKKWIFEIKDNIEKTFSWNLNEKWLYVDYLSILDKVYYLWKYQSWFILEKNEIILKDWFYIFELQSIWEDFVIKNEYLKIKPLSPWKIFIDIRDKKPAKIFSFNWVYELEFFNKNEKLTKLVLYPHMYFSFLESRVKAFKNTQLSRLEQITVLKYISKTFNLLNIDSNDYFYFDFYSKNDVDIDLFFVNSLNFIYKKENIESYDLKNMDFLEKKYLRWVDYINKYFTLFFNDDKKIIFYKKNILHNLSNFFDKKNEAELLKYSDSIKDDLEKLKFLSQEDYYSVLKVISFYYNSLLNINDYGYIDNAIKLSQLIYNLNNKKSNLLLDTYFYLNKIYSLNEVKKFNKGSLQQSLIDYIILFFDTKKISIDKNILFFDIDKEKFSFDLEYLWFFLKNILLFDIDYWDYKNFNLTLKLFNFYLSLNSNINNILENKNSEDIIITYNIFLEKIIKELNDKYFLNRDDRNLLVLNTERSLWKQVIDDLENIIKNIYDFFEKNKQYISQKNIIYNSFYEKNNVILEEYILALKNYNEYVLKYDKQKKELINIESILEKDWEDQILSKESFLEYIKKFNYLDLSNIDIKIINDKYYIRNLVFNWNKIDFFLYPFEWNFIDNIVLNGQKLNSTFVLDDLEELYKEKYKNAKDEEKFKYDFKNFFVNTFIKNEDITINVKEQKQETIEEDRFISIFKRDKLFWDRWDFILIDKTLKINFKDVEVIDDNWKYRIFVRKSFFSFLNPNTNNQIIWNMVWEYVMEDKEHYFRDIKINFYDFNTYQFRSELVDIFDSKQFEISRIINILDFNEIFRQEVIKIYNNNNK